MTNAHEIYFDRWQLSEPTKKLETHSSFLYWCQQSDVPVVLKFYKSHSDEAASAQLLVHYAGNGAVQILAHDDEACLLKQVGDGRELVSLTRAGDDAKATTILCDVVERLHSAPAVNIGLKPINDFIADFDEYLARDDIADGDLIVQARQVYSELSASQTTKLNLHGDLHHYNIMQAADGHWLAIDPKGYWGEAEYELGAFLRNPLADDFKNIDMQERLKIIETQLDYDIVRIQQWAFCQAVLASIWADDKAFIKNAHSLVKMNGQ